MAFDTDHNDKALHQDETEVHTSASAPPDNNRPSDGKSRGSWRKRLIFGVLAGALVAVAAYEGHAYWTVGRFMETTDDAYLQADIAEVSPEVTGHIVEVAAQENQPVKVGDVLFRIDDADYRNALEQAQSSLSTHEETLKRINAQIDAAIAQVAQANATRRSAEATARNATVTAGRVRNLNSSSFASQSQLDDAVAAEEEANAQVANAEAAVNSAEANVAVLRAQAAEARSETRALQLNVEQAQRDLDRTVLRAPFDGYVANIAGETGELVSPSVTLAAVVPSGSLYVEANFKETQLAEIRPGATAHISFDILPEDELIGTVTSVSPATGALFSLLPPENATGNFTKVVQRVPVRIALPEEAQTDWRLRAGLSAVISVDTRTSGSE